MLFRATKNLFATTKAPLRVAVTGAAGQIGYSLLPSICSGQMLGKDQPVSIVLIDVPQVKKVLEGVSMEITDCAFPLVKEVVIPDNFNAGFKAVDIAMLVGASPRGPGMERADLLKKNAQIFIEQGKIIDEVASKDCKILVVGNPANTNALIGSTYAKRISKDNWTAMSRLDHDRGLGQLRTKAGCPLEDIKNFCVWGNHSPTMFPDVKFCTIKGKPAIDVVGKDWYTNYFIGCIQKRGAEVINARGKSSAASAANAAYSHIRSWHAGTAHWVSMCVQSRGEYGVPEGLVFSYPVTVSNGKWEIVKGLELDSYQKEMMKKTADELVSERSAIQSMLK